MHDEAKAKETLEWVLVIGRGDEKFIDKRNKMISDATRSDAQAFMTDAKEMLKHDPDAFENLVAADAEKPGLPFKWSQDILNIGKGV